MPGADCSQDLPTVHLVDDDVMVRTALRRLLQSHSFRVFAYESAEEFLADFDNDAPGCLVLDVAMPGIGGLELHRRLDEAGGCPPTVFISGVPDAPTCASVMRGGAVHYLAKPIDERELIRALEQALQHDAVRRLDTRQAASLMDPGQAGE